MQSTYGSGWEPDTLAVAFLSYDNGIMRECDILMNPAITWTLDDAGAFQTSGSSGYSFRSTMIHEVGHCVGLDHNFEGMATMNYQSDPYGQLPFIYMDDAEGMRSLYPGRVKSNTDVGAYFHHPTGDQSVSEVVSFPTTATAGQQLTFTGFWIENVGSEAVGVYVDVYLVNSFDYSTATKYLVGSQYLGNLVRYQMFETSSSITFTIPTNVQAGNYRIGLSVGENGGSAIPTGKVASDNNLAWSWNQIYISGASPSPPPPPPTPPPPSPPSSGL
jgi:hypothetical protein